MNNYSIEDYTFEGLHGGGRNPVKSLAYLIGLVNSPAHEITELKSTWIMSHLYGVEEQSPDGTYLREQQESFCPAGYFPQTPVMLTYRWSPIGAMLERGLEPIILLREAGSNAVATGIWAPVGLDDAPETLAAKTPEELFWGAFAKVSKRAVERQMLVSIIAQPGWSYDGPDILPKWSVKQVTAADRVLWHRKPTGV